MQGRGGEVLMYELPATVLTDSAFIYKNVFLRTAESHEPHRTRNRNQPQNFKSNWLKMFERVC
jgi:hypothetical protein